MIGERKLLACVLAAFGAVSGLLLPNAGITCHNEKTCPHNPPTITAALSLPLSGSAKSIGDSMQRGYQLWAESVNRAGGIRKNKVQLEIRDNATERRKAVSQVIEFVSSERFDVIFGSRLREPVVETLGITESAQHPMLLTASLSTDTLRKFKWAVSIVSPLDSYLTGVADTARQLELKRIALLREEALDWPNPVADGLRKALAVRNLEVVLEVPLKPGQTQFDARQLRDARPDAVVVINVAPAAALPIAADVRAAIPGLQMLVLTSGADKLGTGAHGILRPAVWHPKLRTPGNPEFLKAYESKYDGQQPDINAAVAYGTGQVFADALAKTYDPGRRIYLIQALARLTTATILGHYKLDGAGMQTGHQPALIQWQSGEERVVWPKEFATSDLIRLAKP